MTSTLSLTRLMHLSSSTLPVGAYSYSQGLESAADHGHVHSTGSAQAWIHSLLVGPVQQLDAPLWLRLHRAWKQGDHAAVPALNDQWLATRESAELRAEAVQMGYSLRRLLNDLEEIPAKHREAVDALEEPSFASMHALVCVAWRLNETDGLGGWLWSWLENQVMASVRIVPLGQTDGQRLLRALGECLPLVLQEARQVPDDEVGAMSPGLAHLCSLHETQYTRIYRS